MLQDHSFFSTPLTYFGSLVDEEGIKEEGEWNFADGWQEFFDAAYLDRHQDRVGLFLQWNLTSDLSES